MDVRFEAGQCSETVAGEAFGEGRKGEAFREESKRFFVNYLKQVAQVFVNQRPHDRLGLVVFAGTAVTSVMRATHAAIVMVLKIR